MKVLPQPVALCLAMLSGVAVSLNGAVTAVQTAAFGALSASTQIDLEVGSESISDYALLTSFDKFDPALGTLNEVLLTMEVRVQITAFLETETILDEDFPFSAYWDDSSSFFQADIVYSPTGDTSGYSLLGEFGGFSGVGSEEELPEDWGSPGDFFFTDSNSDEFGGFAFGGTTVTSGSYLVTDPNYNPVDFVGTGTVTGLEIGPFAFIDTALAVVDNVSNVILGVEIEMDPGTVTLQYSYTPVPEPSHATLAAGLLLGLWLIVRRRRRA